MNSICRAIPTKNRLLLRPLLLLQSHYSTTTATSNTYTITNPRFTSKRPPQQPPSNVDFPKPSEVPFQPKVANSVRVIGHIHTPLKFHTTPDGTFWAAAMLTSSSSTAPSLRIPVIFEGDLAHIATLHLKDNDFVFVAGSLRSDLIHLNASQGQSLVQVLVHTLNFVQESSPVNESYKNERQEESTADHNVGVNDVMEQSWQDLLNMPYEWSDIRLKEDNPKGAAFERKNDGKLLWIDEKTPEWIRHKLDSTTFDQKPISDSCETSLRKDGDSTLGSWRDLVDNPKEWLDYRNSKINGSVKPKYPDFRRKDGGHALWLDKAPQWVFSKLKGMEFDVPTQKSKQGDESWKDLVETPDKWWDNRLNKRNEKAPDFKHKETGQALWLNSSPEWALSKLPPLKTQQDVKKGNEDIPIA